MNRMPSTVSKLRNSVVAISTLWVSGFIRSNVTAAPMRLRMADRTMTMPMRIRKITTGCGTMFPTLSTTSRIFCMTVLDSAAAWLMAMPSMRAGRHGCLAHAARQRRPSDQRDDPTRRVRHTRASLARKYRSVSSTGEWLSIPTLGWPSQWRPSAGACWANIGVGKTIRSDNACRARSRSGNKVGNATTADIEREKIIKNIKRVGLAVATI